MGFNSILKIVVRIYALIACAAMLGCATSGGNANSIQVRKEIIDVADLSKSGHGVVFLAAHFPNEKCSISDMKIAKDNRDSYKVITTPFHANRPNKLLAGEYHIVGVQCLSFDGRSAGKYKRLEDRKIGLSTVKHVQSYAKFNLRKGDIIRAGVLGLYTRKNKIYKVEVRDYSSTDKTKLSKEFPNLFPKSKKKLMHAKLRKPSDS